MDNVFTDLEDAIYQLVISEFPTWRVIFQGQGGPEPQLPYLGIKSTRLDPIGEPYQIGLIDVDGNDVRSYFQNYYANILFEVIGTGKGVNEAARMCSSLMNYLKTSSEQKRCELGLSLFRVSPMFPVERQRELDTVVYHQLTVRFGFAVRTDDTQYSIDEVGIDGKYYGVGNDEGYIDSPIFVTDE